MTFGIIMQLVARRTRRKPIFFSADRLADSQEGPEQGMLAFDPVSYGRIARGMLLLVPKEEHWCG